MVLLRVSLRPLLARRFRVSVRAVRNIRAQPFLHNRGRGGSRPRIDQRVERPLRGWLRRTGNHTAEEIRVYLRDKLHTDVSIDTVRRALKRMRLSPRIERIVPMSSHAQAAERHAFAVAHRRDDLKQWIFEDESTVVIRDTGRIVWTERGAAQPTRPVANLRASVPMLGMIWWSGHYFTRFRGYLTASKYLDTISPTLSRYAHQWRHKTFLHDRASYHRSEAIERYFADRQLSLLENAVKSPKWNAIEYAWKWIKEHVKRAAPTTQRELERAVDRAFLEFDPAVRRKCIEKAQAELRAEAAR